MYANKLKHQKPAFAAIRGAIAWLTLMVIWFAYPYVQRSAPTSLKTDAVKLEANSGASDIEQQAPTIPGHLSHTYEELSVLESQLSVPFSDGIESYREGEVVQ